MSRNRKAVLWGLALVVFVLVAIGIERLVAFVNPPLPPAQPVREARWLEQGWSQEDRYWFHHATQGTSTLPIPYAWFVAVAEPKILPFGKERLFIEDAYMQKLGFIPSPPSGGGSAGPAGGREKAYGYKARIGGVPVDAKVESPRGLNPAGMPVGFAITRAYRDPTTGQMLPDQVGLTCAACHTGHLEYNGVSLRIDGANAASSLGDLTNTLGAALLLTKVLPWRFDSFAERVLGPNATRAQKQALRAELGATIKALAAEAKGTAHIDKRDGVPEGFNRLDALNRIGNEVFYINLLPAKSATFDPLDNYAALTAPVKYPHLWTTPWFTWAQYDASIGQPAVRNVGEAIGVLARVNMTTYDQPHKLWVSSVPVGNLARMEQQIEGPNPLEREPDGRVRGFKGLSAPKWPQDVLGRIDVGKAAAGRKVYALRCQGCHMPPLDDPNQAIYTPSLWTTANEHGESYLKVNIIPLSVVGTDPGQANILSARKIKAPLALGLQPGVTDPVTGVTCFTNPTPATTELSFGQALASAVQFVVDKFHADRAVPIKSDTAEADKGNRPNCVQAPPAYKARPLNGIWATPPYLHNGSVPSLHALLGPPGERPGSFCLGNRAYDPKLVGLDVSSCPRGAFKLNTSVKGSSNQGHEFRDAPAGTKGVVGPALSNDERLAVIEFLKTQ
ncbi:di-heme-cytochrome C peroxidase [Caulobacter hibisci]|uniref:Cytochrome c domain-containing protein n=1 Tax=Caulobacter hibisci TaxID=2035993 RepID=A0ABS0SZG0_9CAUL|nr:di-heme-cytochrome C peroxidase [Caulobacter hibisci]MBI1685015.1 hypothetical protein [Caulobacter hibisci]